MNRVVLLTALACAGLASTANATETPAPAPAPAPPTIEEANVGKPTKPNGPLGLMVTSGRANEGGIVYVKRPGAGKADLTGDPTCESSHSSVPHQGPIFNLQDHEDMLSRRALAAALVALVCISSASASAITDDPYTTSDGTVVDPTKPDQPRDAGSDSIYMPLSHNGPMSGMGRPHAAGGHTRGIRSQDDDGYLI